MSRSDEFWGIIANLENKPPRDVEFWMGWAVVTVTALLIIALCVVGIIVWMD